MSVLGLGCSLVPGVESRIEATEFNWSSKEFRVPLAKGGVGGGDASGSLVAGCDSAKPARAKASFE
jgi:hypothetical protein